jgi:hypothetical protein
MSYKSSASGMELCAVQIMAQRPGNNIRTIYTDSIQMLWMMMMLLDVDVHCFWHGINIRYIMGRVEVENN